MNEKKESPTISIKEQVFDNQPCEDEGTDGRVGAHGLQRQLRNRHAQMITIGQSYSRKMPHTKILINYRWCDWDW